MPQWSHINPILKYYYRTILYGIFLLGLFLMPGNRIPSPGIGHLDKLFHFLVFFILYSLAFWENAQYRSSSTFTRWSIRMAVLSILFGLLIELIQGSALIQRSFELADLLADSAGVLAGMLMCRYVAIENVHRFFRKS